MPPAAVHEKAWRTPVAGSLNPTTWPLGFTARAELPGPPSVLRSIMPPAAVHEKAWRSLVNGSLDVSLNPTT
jgi:hypothetical protein